MSEDFVELCSDPLFVVNRVRKLSNFLRSKGLFAPRRRNRCHALVREMYATSASHNPFRSGLALARLSGGSPLTATNGCLLALERFLCITGRVTLCLAGFFLFGCCESLLCLFVTISSTIYPEAGFIGPSHN